MDNFTIYFASTQARALPSIGFEGDVHPATERLHFHCTSPLELAADDRYPCASMKVFNENL